MNNRRLRAVIAGPVAALAVVGALMTAPTASADTSGAADAPAAAAAGSGQVEVSGTIRVVHGEGDDHQYLLKIDGGPTVRLGEGFTAAPHTRFHGILAIPGSEVSLRGAQGRRALQELSRSGGVAKVVDSRTSAPRLAAPKPSEHRTYVAQATNLGAFDVDVSTGLAELAVAQQYWVRESAGRITSWAAPTTATPVTISPAAALGCGLGADGATFDKLVSEAAAQAFPGIDFYGANSGNHLVVLVPPGCQTDGVVGRAALGTSLGDGGPSIGMLQNYPGSLTFTMAHEFGHTFSLEHANSETLEYGDLYEVMGSSNGTPPVLGASYRNQLGILAPGEVIDVNNASAAVTLAPRSAEAGQRAARFIDPDSGDQCFVEFRNGAGNDAGAAYSYGTLHWPESGPWTYRPGVTITCDDSGRGYGYELRVATSGQVALLGGEVWTNPSGTYSVSVGGVGAEATVTTLSTPGPALRGGRVRVGKGRALEKVHASVRGVNGTVSGVRFEWSVKGRVIATSRGATFFPPISAAGKKVTVRATAYGVGRSPVSMKGRTKIKKATFYRDGPVRYVKIKGKAKVGKKLKAVTRTRWVNYFGMRPAGFRVKYQWLRNGRTIKGAKGRTYKPSRRDRGAHIQVVERPSAPGFDKRAYTRSRAKRIR